MLLLVNRTAIELEKKTRASNLEQRQILENNVIIVAQEIEKLHAEYAIAENRAREAASAAANPSNDLLSCSLPTDKHITLTSSDQFLTFSIIFI